MPQVSKPNDAKTALYTVCLFLAHSGSPHKELGFDTQSAAFEAIGRKFSVPANTVKNERDAFDNFTDSDREGWKKDLAPRLKPVFSAHAATTRDDLKALAIEILKNDWSGEMNDALPDLEALQAQCRARAAQIPLAQQYLPSEEVWLLVADLYKATGTTDEVEIVGNSTLVLTTPKGNFLTISSQEIPRCWAVRPYVLGILAYEAKIDELAREIGLTSRSSAGGKEVFKKLPSPEWEVELESNTVSEVKDAIENRLGLSSVEQEYLYRFLADSAWSGVAKTLERGDWPITAIQSAGGWLAVASARRGELAIALSKSAEFERLMTAEAEHHKGDQELEEKPKAEPLTGGENIIFYGAPGTGKSYRVDAEIVASGQAPIRTVFHPDLQNSDFFGCLKPRMDRDNVRYEFAPGPFMEALAQAYVKPDEPVYLVIEELNRAAAAAVFGDLFLLLDRDDKGAGEYSVSFPSPESRVWFEEKTKTVHERIILPSNLFIYATMNSADQGVYPIDTAFRRRWRQEYLPIDYTAGPDGEVAYIDADNKQHTMEWRAFVKALNDYLVSNHSLAIAEDRLLGQWFVKKKELDGASIPEKILLYLWDDLLRHEGRDQVFNTENITTYGALDKAAKDGGRFLSAGFLGVLNTISKTESEEVSEDDAG